MCLLFFSLPLSKDKDIDKNAIIRGDNYGIRGALALEHKKQKKFNNKNDEVYDRLIS